MDRVPMSEGYPFGMSMRFPAGIPSRYTAGNFVVREELSATARTVVECDENTGLTIDHASGRALIAIDGIATDNLGVDGRSVQCWGELRLYDPENPGDRIGDQFAVGVRASLFPSAP